MRRKPLMVVAGLVAASLLIAVGSARGDEVMEPYPPTPPPPLVTPPVPPPMAPAPAAPTVMVPAPAYPYAQPYYPPQPYFPPAYAPAPPVNVREVERPRYGLMTAGLVVFGASWTFNALGGWLGNEWRVAVPVAGPLMYANTIDTSDPTNLGARLAVTMLVFDSLIETAGVAMFLAGALTHHRVRIMERAQVVVLPTASYASAGLAAVGRF
jgi:hypothetical protein